MSVTIESYRFPAFCWNAWREGFRFGLWFRLWGYGLAIGTMRPMFSERMGYARRTMRVFGVKFCALIPGHA